MEFYKVDLEKKIASFYGDSDIKFDANELLKENGVTKEQIAEDVEKML